MYEIGELGADLDGVEGHDKAHDITVRMRSAE